MSNDKHRCGYVGILGRPNAGKSTWLNQVLGQKISITSSRPQTTRNRVAGIYNSEGVQAILVDTPGHHKAWTGLNQALVNAAESALADVDVVLFLVDLVPAVEAAKAEKLVLSKGERVLLELIEQSGKPCVLGLNKIDVVHPDWMLPVVEAWQAEAEFAAVMPISALDGRGAQALLDELVGLLPEHPPLFPSDQVSESTEKFVVAEIVREKLFRHLRKEIPYSTAVEVETFDESQREGGKPIVRIRARILVERDSQKGIVIGKKGANLKKVGTQAREDIQKLLGCKVHLELFVKVVSDWSNNPRIRRDLGLE